MVAFILIVMRKEIIGLLRSKDRLNWAIAILNHKLGGFTIQDAYRWFIWGLFESAGLDNGFHCQGLFYEYWAGGGGVLVFNFFGLKVMIYGVDISDGTTDKVRATINIKERTYDTGVLDFDIFKDVEARLPAIKPYSDFEGHEGTNQSYFYSLLVFCLEKHKQAIVNNCIDKHWVCPKRKEYYKNTLFPV